MSQSPEQQVGLCLSCGWSTDGLDLAEFWPTLLHTECDEAFIYVDLSEVDVKLVPGNKFVIEACFFSLVQQH